MAYNRDEELKAFDGSKAGVKGLIDSGVNKVPRIFIRPPDELQAEKSNKSQLNYQLPVINLDGFQISDERKIIVEQIQSASEQWGFFQVTNHGIPQNVLDDTISGVRNFHEQDPEAKKGFYTRDPKKRVRYNSNHDLFKPHAACWRDTLYITTLVRDPLDPEEVPEACRDSTNEFIDQVTNLGNTLLELLSEALGLKFDYFNSIECTQSKTFTFHYYPPCPEPELVMGSKRHTDPSLITILLQDQLGGLQVLHENQWVNVKPIPGGLVVNIADLLQILSNGKFKSVEHRVLANGVVPRISAACFCYGAATSRRLYGPIKQLISGKNPTLFKEFTMPEYLTELLAAANGTSVIDVFKL